MKKNNLENPLSQTAPGDDPEKSKADLRELTKRHAPSERRQTAKDIWALRKAHFAEQDELSKEGQKLAHEELAEEYQIEKISSQIASLDQAITMLKDSLISRLFKRNEIRQLETEKEPVEADLVRHVGLKTEILAGLEEIENRKTAKKNLENARQRLADFYDSQQAQVPEYLSLDKDDQLAAQIPEIIKEHGVTFIHGLRLSNDNLRVNSVLRPNLPWDVKLKTLVGLAPLASCSAIRPGFDKDDFWTALGVVLSDGEVKAATPKDMGTKAEGAKERQFMKRSQPGGLAADIAGALQNQDSYNEFIIDNPEVCGLFIMRDDENAVPADKLRKFVLPPDTEIYPVAQELALPVFVLENGEYWLAEYDQKEKCYQKKELVPNPSRYQNAFSEEKKNEIREELVKNYPVNVDSWPDFRKINCFAKGQLFYLERGDLGHLDKKKGIEIEYDGSSYQGLTTINYPGGHWTIVRSEDNKYYRLQEDNFPEERGRAFGLNRDRNKESKWFYLGSGTVELDSPFSDIPTFLAGFESKIQTYAQRAEKRLPQEKLSEDFLKRLVKEMAFYAHGFSVQAENLADFETAERARQIGERYVSREEYEALLAERLGPSGEIRIRPEELGK